MSGTTPRTWIPFDPSLADNMGDYVRNNLDFLKDRQEDLILSVKDLNLFKADNLAFQAAAVHYAVYDMTTLRHTTSRSFERLDSTLGITLTPLSDLVLFTVQFQVRFGSSQGKAEFGVWKDSASYSLNYSGGDGNKSTFFQASEPEYVYYTVPVAVVRNQQVSLYPSWRFTGSRSDVKTLSTVPMILIVQDVGAYE